MYKIRRPPGQKFFVAYPYFAYSSMREQSNKRSGTRLKTESETGERRLEAHALRARETLTPRFTDFFTDFRKKTDCFAV